MAVMKELAIGGVTYDTVGEASVTQVQTTGTKIATVTIDGTGTDLYSPSYSALTTQEIEDAVDAAFATQYALTAGTGSGITFYATISGDTPPQTVSDQLTEAAEGTTVYLVYFAPAMGILVVKEQSTQTAITTSSVGYTAGGAEIHEFTMPADAVIATIESVGP